jgi:putative Mn2+ efflux pump MntP
MGIIELLFLSVALGSDAFSVAICVGLAGATIPERVRLAAGFGLFQFLMPIIGLFVGQWFGKATGDVAAHIGGGILVALGLIMIYRTAKDGFHCPSYIHTSTIALLSASVGVSIDALAVGFGLGALNSQNIVMTSSVIGLVAFTMTGVGLEVGNQIGKIVQNRAAIAGGVILVAIGARVILRS